MTSDLSSCTVDELIEEIISRYQGTSDAFVFGYTVIGNSRVGIGKWGAIGSIDIARKLCVPIADRISARADSSDGDQK